MKILFTVLLTATSAFAQIFTTDFEFAGDGTYMVPVEDQTLLPFSLFEVSKIEFKQNGNQAKLDYVIPISLTGIENKISLDGVLKDGVWKMKGDGVKMDCHQVQGFFNCPVSYRELNVDESARVEFLKTSAATQAEFDSLLATARFFDGERIGVLRFKVSAP